jgi:hypothetical protein
MIGLMNVRAQDALFAPAAPSNPISFLRIGAMVGRDGAALGPGFMLEMNPQRKLFRGLGFYGFAGLSSIKNYNGGNGVQANFSDHTIGFGVEYRLLHIGQRFTIGSFGQAAYYSSRVVASYFDSDLGGMVQYRDSDKGTLVTIGPQVEIEVAKGITAFVRLGKGFGDNVAATTVGGFSMNTGVLVSSDVVGKSFEKGFRRVMR